MFSRIFFVPSDFVRIKTFSGGRTMEFTNLSRLKRFLTDKLYFPDFG